MEMDNSAHNCTSLDPSDVVYRCGECRAEYKTICQLFNHLVSHRANTSTYMFDDLIKVGYLRRETSDSSIQTSVNEDELLVYEYSEKGNSKTKSIVESTENIIEGSSKGSSSLNDLSMGTFQSNNLVDSLDQVNHQTAYIGKRKKNIIQTRTHVENDISRKIIENDTSIQIHGKEGSSRNNSLKDFERASKVSKAKLLKVHKTWIPQTVYNVCDQKSRISDNDSPMDVEQTSPYSSLDQEQKLEKDITENKSRNSKRTNSLKKSSLDCVMCHICGKVCRNRKSLHSHVTEQHQSPDCMKTCETCGKSFPTNSKLKQHLIVHFTATQTYSCETCNKTFPRKNALNAHVKFMHSDNSNNMLKCPQCDKTFKYPSSFSHHIQAHQEPFKCQTCEMVFSHRGSLKRHEMRHSGVRAHCCGICGHRFIQKTAYWVHMEKHHDLTKSKLQAQTSTGID